MAITRIMSATHYHRPATHAMTEGTVTAQWAHAHGPWHLTETADRAHCGARLGLHRHDFPGIPTPHCRICAARRRHQLAHPQPLTPVAHDDLDLTSDTDRGVYRKRVAEHFDLAQVNTIIQHVLDAGGHRPPAQRQTAVTALADAWIRLSVTPRK